MSKNRSGRSRASTRANSRLMDRLGVVAWVVLGLLVVGGLVAVVSAWQHEPVAPQAQAPTHHTAELAGQSFELELALTPHDRETGLMHRRSLDERGGMLFGFPDERQRMFWMKNCLIPLDIIFLDSAGQVVSIHTLPPPDPLEGSSQIPRCHSAGPARYVIELNAGTAQRIGLEHGMSAGLNAEPLKRWVR